MWVSLRLAIPTLILSPARSSAAIVPLITGVTPATLTANNQNVIHVTWPPHTDTGIIEIFDGGGTYSTPPTAAVIDYSDYSFPVSYRAVACSKACDPTTPQRRSPEYSGSGTAPMSVNQLAGPAPVLEVARDPEWRGLRPSTVRLGVHTGAPVIFLFRDGSVIAAIDNPQPDPTGVIRSQDSGASSDPSIFHTRPLATPDCWPAAASADSA